jgi:hypothetical protein
MTRGLILITVALALALGAGASRATERTTPSTQCDPTKQG